MKKGKEFKSQKHLRAEGIKPAKIKIKILRTKITRKINKYILTILALQLHSKLKFILKLN